MKKLILFLIVLFVEIIQAFSSALDDRLIEWVQNGNHMARHGAEVQRLMQQNLYWITPERDNAQASFSYYMQKNAAYLREFEARTPSDLFYIGQKFYKGEIVGQDYSQAFRWIKLAAEQNHGESQYLIGLMYYKGQGVLQDYDNAEHYLAQAVRKNHDSARTMLKEVRNKIEAKAAEIRQQQELERLEENRVEEKRKRIEKEKAKRFYDERNIQIQMQKQKEEKERQEIRERDERREEFRKEFRKTSAQKLKKEIEKWGSSNNYNHLKFDVRRYDDNTLINDLLNKIRTNSTGNFLELKSSRSKAIFSYTRDDDEWLIEIIHLMRKNTSIRFLKIDGEYSRTSFTYTQENLIAEMIKQNKYLQEVTFECIKFSNKGIERISDAIKENSSILHVQIINLSIITFYPFANMLENNNTLRRLTVNGRVETNTAHTSCIESSSVLYLEEIKAFEKALISNTSLLHLDVSPADFFTWEKLRLYFIQKKLEKRRKTSKVHSL